jgi:hypothetical protein
VFRIPQKPKGYELSPSLSWRRANWSEDPSQIHIKVDFFAYSNPKAVLGGEGD